MKKIYIHNVNIKENKRQFGKKDSTGHETIVYLVSYMCKFGKMGIKVKLSSFSLL